MTAVLEKKVSDFVQWARQYMPTVREELASNVADAVCAELLRVDTQLGVEIDEELEEKRGCIITAFSDPTRFALVRRIVDELQGVEGWTVRALKPAEGFEFFLSVGGHKIEASDLKFVPLGGVPGGVLILIDPGVPLPSEQEAEELAWLVVEAGIGEELAARLQHVEFGSDTPGSNSLPISGLLQFVEELPASRFH